MPKDAGALFQAFQRVEQPQLVSGLFVRQHGVVTRLDFDARRHFDSPESTDQDHSTLTPIAYFDYDYEHKLR